MPSGACKLKKVVWPLGKQRSEKVMTNSIGEKGGAYTPEVLNDITREALNAMHSGKPIDPDVLP